MLPVLALIILFVILLLPQFWVQKVIKKYSVPVETLQGTGGELAQHLVKRFKLDEVSIEKVENGNDHYNPETKTIALSESNYDQKSLAAVTIAVHEFGHALQHKTNYKPLLLRTTLAKFAAVAEKIASIILIASPFAFILAKIPAVGLIMLLAGFTIMCLPVILHIITLPVEFDASFNRALPILSEGGYLSESAMPIAKKILTAAALTYVSASLSSLLNFYRWFLILRR
ncbi:MAG: zinc metallopeptidase [Gammaproteobacteria bacterium]|tara:strand:+ start:38 stop:724 length:687 start_codon:yes stop_codon:yes gene_type:complete